MILTMISVNDQLNELVKVALAERQVLTTENDNNIQDEIMDESAKSPNFFQDHKSSVEINERKYTAARIKSLNFLSNISYVGINKEEFYNENFIFDVYLLVTKNLNPFSLNGKLKDQNKHQMIYMLRRECMPQRFCKHICKDKNFMYLNRKNVLQPKVLEIITDFLNEGKDSYIELRNNSSHYKDIFQYVYSNVFSEIYCSTERRGFNLRCTFHIMLKTYNDKKNIES